MYEVEMKVRAPHAGVRDRLKDAGGSREATVFQADTYYDAPHRSFVETDEALRVRREMLLDADAPKRVGAIASAFDEGASGDDVESVITYKGPRVDETSKTRREVETGVADGDRVGAIFDALGFDAAATVRKRREHWVLDGVTVTLDDVDGLGEYVECEMETACDLDAARSVVGDTLRSLGLDPESQIRTSYLGLLLEANDD